MPTGLQSYETRSFVTCRVRHQSAVAVTGVSGTRDSALQTESRGGL